MTVVDCFMSGNAERFHSSQIDDGLPTIGIVTACHTYTQFLERWCAGIRGLRTKPDQIVIAATNPMDVIAEVEGKLDAYNVVKAEEPFSLGGYLNTAIEACDTDWIVWIGVDDRYRPGALDGLKFMSVDVAAMGMQWSAGGEWVPSKVEASHILQVSSNLIPCGSAFRRHLWKRRPFNTDLAPFEDWALWVGFAALGAKFGATGRVDFDYYQHAAQIQPPQEPTKSNIKKWLATLPIEE